MTSCLSEADSFRFSTDSIDSIDSSPSTIRPDTAKLHSAPQIDRSPMDRDTAFSLQRHQLNSPISEREPTLTPGDIDGPRVNDHRHLNGLYNGLPGEQNHSIHNNSNTGPHNGAVDTYMGMNNGQFDDDEVHGAPSIDSMSISKRSAVSGSRSLSKLANFFGPEIFQIVLHNPSTVHQLTKFAQSRFCGENLDFLEKVCGGVPDFLQHRLISSRFKSMTSSSTT
jgi:hypothetical protein